jgi:hypothetical protein
VVTITVKPLLPVAISISESENNVCAGTTVNFSSTIAYGGTTPAYQWKKNNIDIEGATLSTYSYNPENNDVITCVLTSSEECTVQNPVTSNGITMVVYPLLPVSITIYPSVNDICDGTQVTFTSTVANEGASPAYQWRLNGSDITGATSSSYTYIPANDDVISCRLTSSEACTQQNPVLSNEVTMVVHPILPVSVSIGASLNNICDGTEVLFTANPVNGGTTPGYQWKKNSADITGATNQTYSYIPVNGDVISVVLTTSEVCQSGSPATSNAITMVVYPILPVSVSIVSSATTICAGTNVLFTATPVNGGLTPLYQWKVGGTDVPGATNATYTYPPINTDEVTCVLTTSEQCYSGSPATSNAIVMNVLPVLTPSVVIQASATSICSGNPVLFTATPSNIGSEPAYQWKVNSTNVTGATNATYSYNPVNGDAVSCQVTSTYACTSVNPAISNVINMTVTTTLNLSVTISTPVTTICAGTPVTFTAVAVDAGPSPSYQWKVNGSNVSGATSATYNYAPANQDVVTCEVTSGAPCTIGSPATSNAITMTVKPYLPVTVSISTPVNPICVGSTATFTATPGNGGTNPAYQWRKGGIDISGATQSTYSYVPANNDVITCVMTSDEMCTTGNPATSNAITMSVQSIYSVSISINTATNTVCAGTQVTFNSLIFNGGTIPAYQWKNGGTPIVGATNSSYSYIPQQGDVITCQLTSNLLCTNGNPANSNAITMTVNPVLPVSVTILESANNVCEGANVVFTATPVNGGTNPAYQWKKGGVNISGATGSTYNYGVSNGDEITCELTSNVTCPSGSPALSNAITMTTIPNLPVSVSIVRDANSVCAGTTVNFTATAVNGGLNPTYQWKVNGTDAGTNSATFSYQPANVDNVTCVVTSSEVCTSGNPAASNTLTMIVNAVFPVSVSITASNNNVCQGTSILFTATGINGGATPSYQWYKNSVIITGATASTYSYAPANGDVITCVFTSSIVCTTGNPATSNAITMNIIPSAPVSVIVTPSANPNCGGGPVTFTATPTNGGTTPAYQWRVNGQRRGTNNPVYSYTPLNGDVVTVTLTSNVQCATGSPATSTPVTMSVLPILTPSVAIGASVTSICSGNTVNFTATPTNGGTTPAYQWKVNSTDVVGATNATYSYMPANGDAVSCQMTSSYACTSSNPVLSNVINMSVTQTLNLAVTISTPVTTICTGTSVTYTASAVDAGPSPAYQWKVNGNSISGATGTSYSFVPADQDAVTCEVTSGAPCTMGSPATSNSITMTVKPYLPVSVTISTPVNPICIGSNATFTAVPVNGGAIPAYQWKKGGSNISGATMNTYDYVPANNDVITCVMTSDEMCTTGNPATSNAVTMSVQPIYSVSISISTASNTVCSGSSVTFNSLIFNGGTTPAYQWKNGGVPVSGATNSSYSYIPQNGDVITCQITSSILCTSGNPATSNAITMTVNPVLPVSVSIVESINNVCEGTNVIFTATPVNGGSTPAYQWKKGGLNISGATGSTYNYNVSNGDVITCELTSNATCPSGSPALSNTITMTTIPNLPVSVSIIRDANSVCAGTTVNFTATAVNEGLIPTYQWKVNGTDAGTNSNLFSYQPTNLDNVTCVVTSSEVCTSGNPATSNTLTMIVNPVFPVSVSILASNNNVCQGTSITFTATGTNGGITPSYQWYKNSVIITGATASTYSYAPANGDVITCVFTSSIACTSGNPATSNAVTMTIIPSAPVSVTVTPSANPNCGSSNVIFTATPTNGGSTPAYQWRVNGQRRGTNNPVYSYIPVNGDVVTVTLTSNAQCATGSPATSVPVTMSVLPVLTPSVVIQANATTVCAGISVNFTATPTNGGTLPLYQWKVNTSDYAGATNATFTYVPADGDVVRCQMTSSYACPSVNPVNSGDITITVVPLLNLAVTISTPATTVCEGTEVTLTAVTVDEGPSPSYQWKVNGTDVPGATSTVYTFIPVDQNVVTCMVSSGAPCTVGSPATSNAITFTVNPYLPVGVYMEPDANPVCEGSLVTFTAYGENAGNAPVFAWYVNNIVQPGITGDTYNFTPNPFDVVYCVMTSNAMCKIEDQATSDPIIINVNPVGAASVTIDVTESTVCAGTQVTLTATPVNGGYVPMYQWKKSTVNIPGATASSYSYNPADGDVITCVMTSFNPCATGSPATSNAIVMTVNPSYLVSVTIVASSNPVVNGTTVTLTATGVNAGVSPVYQWYVNSVPVGTNSDTYSYIPADNDAVYCKLSSDIACPLGNPATSNILTIRVKEENVAVNGIVVHNGENVCYNAVQTITVAATSPFTVQNGGRATMIAGVSILYLPGTVVQPGGYLHGYISDDFCTAPPLPGASVIAGNDEQPPIVEKATFRVYPNPTKGSFTLEIKGTVLSDESRVEIFNMRAESVVNTTLPAGTKHLFNLSDFPAGLYFVKIINGHSVETIKLAKSH